MKLISILFLLGWFGAVGFTVWVTYTAGHPVWACVIALLGIALVHVSETESK